jgi:predicted transcriptional regulator
MHSSGKRSRLEIYMDILTAVSKGEHKPTSIMYRSNLSWRTCTRYINRLRKEGLLTVTKSGYHRVVNLTSQGREAMQDFTAAVNWAKKIEKE